MTLVWSEPHEFGPNLRHQKIPSVKFDSAALQSSVKKFGQNKVSPNRIRFEFAADQTISEVQTEPEFGGFGLLFSSSRLP